jgi:alkanesulfonate monooxygenase SsuD/methylene tetrahydromethanopterin reductase-like flavin-dependent oxidoreductase (luciferase family)
LGVADQVAGHEAGQATGRAAGTGFLVGLVLDAPDTADPDAITDQVLAAEGYGLNFAVFDDGPGAPAGLTTGRWSLDPIEAAAFASARTTAIGLIATAAATHAEPYHLSNRFSSLDWGSSGRAGWLVTVDSSPARARAYSAAPPGKDAARREADAVVGATRRLWDSWEDGALIADSATGRFLDNDKIHYVDAVPAPPAGPGRLPGDDLFSIRGPALMPRPPQGQVPLLARARDGLAGPDVTIVTADTEAGLIRAAGQARGAGAVRVFAALSLIPDLLATLRRLAPHADGVVLRASNADAALTGIAQAVLPALADDGFWAPPRPGQTLRQQLGLPRPPSRYAASIPAASQGA